MFRFVYCLVILTVVCISCAESTPTPAPTTPIAEKEFPLAVNNTWIYHAMRYDGYNPDDIMTLASVVTETVVEIKNTPPYFVAKIRQDWSAEVAVYVPPSMQDILPNPAASNEYWLVVSGNRTYRQDSKLDLPNLSSTSRLELVLPLNLGNKWYETDEMAKMFPDKKNDSMLHKVTRVGAVTVPAGSFSNCYYLEEGIGGGTFENWFCPGVGFVDLKDDHHGTPFGSHRVLLRYRLN